MQAKTRLVEDVSLLFDPESGGRIVARILKLSDDQAMVLSTLSDHPAMLKSTLEALVASERQPTNIDEEVLSPSATEDWRSKLQTFLQQRLKRTPSKHELTFRYTDRAGGGFRCVAHLSLSENQVHVSVEEDGASKRTALQKASFALLHALLQQEP